VNAAIRTARLTKSYGRVLALDDVSLEVGAGEVFGFLGPNGAGKTTTIRVLLDLIRPTRGRAEVLGLDTRAGSVEIRRRTGYLPGELALYEQLTGSELLRFFANLRDMRDLGDAADLADLLDLDLSRHIRALSRGNKQKVGLVQALMHRPELLILDEPTTGLDPIVQQRVHRLILDAKAEGRTVFLSSHALGEVEQVADHVGIVRAGRLVAVEEVVALKAKAMRRLEVHFADGIDPGRLRGVEGVRELHVDGRVARFAVTGPMDHVVKTLANLPVVDLVSHEPDLEEIFLTYYADADANTDGSAGDAA